MMNERKEQESEQSRRTVIVIFTIVPTILFAILSIWTGWLLFSPVGSVGTKTLTVYRGDNFRDVVDSLNQMGLLRSRWLFKQLASQRNLPSRLKAGIYYIPTPISIWNLANWLSEAKPKLIRLTVWEGMMAKEIAQRIQQLGLGDANRFLDIVFNRKDSINLPFEWHGDLEGLLFPATYYLPPLRDGNEEYVVQLMVKSYINRFWKPYRDEINRNPLSMRQLVTLASIVQWEVKVDDERPIVAGVLMNRLQKNMKLEVDATALYALGKRKNRVLYKDLQVDSPYNTYCYTGLPPGAICSPGLQSLLASLRPKKVPYLFYVARGDGRHTFSRSYKEHLNAVYAYRRRQNKHK